MSKLVIFLVIVALVVWWFRRQRATRPAARSTDNETTMVRCAACDLYLPPGNATQKGPRWFCERHR
jgi:hypothetical protein